MAARTKRIVHDANTRAKIQTSQIINRLTKHMLGEIDLTTTQIQAARILLDRTLPVLSSVEHGGEVSHKYVMRSPEPIKSADEWATQYRTLQ